MLPPTSRMDVLSSYELHSLLTISPLVFKYNVEIDVESADEILTKRISEKMEIKQQQEQAEIQQNTP
jgi:hypothetical protein